MITVLIPKEFYEAGQFYEYFTQVTDEEVISDLKKTDDRNRNNNM